MDKLTVAFATSLLILGACDGAPTAPGAPDPSQPLAEAPLTPSAPPFSVSPGRLAFVSTRDGDDYIFTVNPDGTNLTRLVRGTRPAWSPDGRTLAFEWWDGQSHEIRTIDADGSSRLLADDGAYFPAWSPDGARVAFARAAGIYVVDRDGSGERLLIGTDSLTAWTGFGRSPNDGSYMWGPAWSPDGRWIAVAAFGLEGSQPVLLVTDSEGRAPMPGSVPLSVGHVATIDWSPDGGQLLFSRSVEAYPGVWAERIVTVDVATWIETTHPFGGAYPRWASDGTLVLFTSPTPWACAGQPCEARIWVGDPATGRSEQLVADHPSAARRYTDTHAVQAPGSD